MMKTLMIAALLAGQLPIAAPASAVELSETRTQQMGAFAGLRLRVPLDGGAQQRPVRAGLTVAPTMQSRAMSGETRTRIGEGLELGVAGRQPVRLLLAGQDLRRLAAAQQDGEDEDQDDGPGTVGWIAIGFAGLVLVGAGIVYLMFEDINED